MKHEKVFYKPHTESTGMYPAEHYVPMRGSEGAAGWDLAAAEETLLKRFEPKIVPVKFDIEVPAGHALLVLPRSSNPKRGLLVPNAPGLIDEDYRGAMGVWLMWFGKDGAKEFYRVEKGDRIAQAVLIEYVKQDWERKSELSPTTRGRGGYGSTGKSAIPKTDGPERSATV